MRSFSPALGYDPSIVACVAKCGLFCRRLETCVWGIFLGIATVCVYGRVSACLCPSAFTSAPQRLLPAVVSFELQLAFLVKRAFRSRDKLIRSCG